jgi:hypothetical protein
VCFDWTPRRWCPTGARQVTLRAADLDGTPAPARRRPGWWNGPGGGSTVARCSETRGSTPSTVGAAYAVERELFDCAPAEAWIGDDERPGVVGRARPGGDGPGRERSPDAGPVVCPRSTGHAPWLVRALQLSVVRFLHLCCRSPRLAEACILRRLSYAAAGPRRIVCRSLVSCSSPPSPCSLASPSPTLPSDT